MPNLLVDQWWSNIADAQPNKRFENPQNRSTFKELGQKNKFLRNQKTSLVKKWEFSIFKII